MIYLTGDTHGQFNRIYEFCERMKTTTNDTMIILGDVGFNYHLNSLDKLKKEDANDIPITLLCLKGNHEKYAGTLPQYEEREAFAGIVYVEKDYPNILFAKDGEVYKFEVDGVEKTVLVIGGAYSIDKYYRLALGHKWFEDEQPSEEVKGVVEAKIKENNGRFDYVFSHTCPMRYEPTEWFLSGVDQSNVDKSTEEWLDNIYDLIDVDCWYCGHYHGEKVVDNVRFMFEDFVALGE